MDSYSYPLGEERSILGKRWTLKDVDWREAMHLSQKYSLPEIIARLLVSRNIDAEQVDSFLEPTLRAYLSDPFQLKDMDKAVDRVILAMSNQEKITLFGDYDVDGATSSSLLKNFFQALGYDVGIYIPDRMKEGYGPNVPAFHKLKQEGTSLVITLDCGTAAFIALEEAQRIELDVIVIDHHLAESNLPPTVALVNPNRDDKKNPYKQCAAVGVAFLFAVALHKRLKERNFYKGRTEPDLLQYLDLVATGTVCDVVPLVGINRAFVRQGLKVLAKRSNLGLKALMDASDLTQQPSAYHLGFVVGPRINAGGRVGESDLGARLLTTRDPLEAFEIAQKLSHYNKQRQEIEFFVLEEATAQAHLQEDPCIITASESWHLGVIGIVAGRLKERFHRPTCVISIDENGIGKGSARSITGVDFGRLIQDGKQAGLLEDGGGHAMAGGFTIEKDKIKDFQKFISEQITKSGIDLTPTVHLEGTLSLKALTNEFMERLEMLAPYGQSNPTPRFMFENLSLVKLDVVGGDHLRCILKSFDGASITAMAFKSVNTPLGEALLKNRNQNFHVIGTLKNDEWQGRKRITLMIDDIAFSTQTMTHTKVA
jgi:single-stranded-DNA-specific exonuclease